MAEMFRVNTRISCQANEWLDKRSEDSGVPKSTLIMLAIENYMQQTEVMNRMADFGELVAVIERLESKVTSDK